MGCGPWYELRKYKRTNTELELLDSARTKVPGFRADSQGGRSILQRGHSERDAATQEEPAPVLG